MFFVAKFIALRVELRELEAAIEEMKPRMCNIVSSQRDKFLELDDCKIYFETRNTYQYPQEIAEREEEIRLEKRKAERSGRAVLIKSTGYVRVTSK